MARRGTVGAGLSAARTPIAVLALAGLAVGSLTVGSLNVSGGFAGPAERSGAPAAQRAADRSLSFEPNVGQAPAGVDFVAQGRGYTLSLRPTAAVVAMPGATVATELIGGRRSAEPVAGDALPGRVNHLSSEAGKSRTDVPTFARVTYHGVYDGVDVVYYGTQGRLEYDFVVSPGADTSDIRVRLAGAGAVELQPDGDLSVPAGDGTLVQQAPVAYQDVGGKRRPVESAYVRLGDADFGFRLGTYDARLPLVIDPVLVYSTYLGGSSGESPGDIAVDASGSAYVVANTHSVDYPVTPGALQTAGGHKMVVTKLSPSGNTLVYSTYLGGTGGDIAGGIAVDGAGNAYVVGTTASSDFPVVNAVQPVRQGGYDAVVAKLDPTGSALVFSTYLGGTADDFGRAVAVDAGGNAHVTGWTESSDFPHPNAFQASPGGGRDAFVAKLGPTGTLMYSTYLGGNGGDSGTGIGVDPSGNAVVGGHTSSTDFPTANPAQAQLRGTADGFVTKVLPSGLVLAYSRYLGGTAFDTVADLTVDAGGNAYATGITLSTDFPTVNPLQPAKAEGEDAFVTKLNTAGAIAYSTYLGGSGEDLGLGITVDPSGRATVTGSTSSSVFPIVNPFRLTKSGFSDAFVSTLAPSGSSLVFSTFLGGSGEDSGAAVAADQAGAVHVLGNTHSTDFPTRNPVQGVPAGGPVVENLFVSKIALTVPTIAGATWYIDGSSTQAGGPGTVVGAFATGAFQNVAYRLILATGQGCATVVAVLNHNARFATSSGFIARTNGTIPAGTPAGTYRICFQDADGETATGGATFTVT